ncbi:MAG: 30S ribosomal protein S6 [Cellulomonadaceae bacterium]|jgi:small subunit ribosomal protein S6|nr:30S ribosomal protein S6 [Cellulomonadaceae bacterium]
MRQYELMMILDPNTEERTIGATIDKLLAVIPNDGGTVDKVDVWGRRTMTFDIKKHSQGLYAVVDFTSTSDTAKELDRLLGLNETVLRTKIMRKDNKPAPKVKKAPAAEAEVAEPVSA